MKEVIIQLTYILPDTYLDVWVFWLLYYTVYITKGGYLYYYEEQYYYCIYYREGERLLYPPAGEEDFHL